MKRERILGALIVALFLLTERSSAQLFGRSTQAEAGYKAFAEKRFGTAIPILRSLATKGDAKSRHLLGEFYFEGGRDLGGSVIAGLDSDILTAAKFYSIAAAQGFKPSGIALGRIHAELRKKAESGDAPSQYQLGVLFYHGYGVPKNPVEAEKWFRKSAEKGDGNGQSMLGFLYRNGEVVVRDCAEALKWFRRAADQGNGAGESNLGTMYYEGLGVQRDYAEAAKWFRKSAERGHASGQNNLGVAYEHGNGVPQDYAEAVRLYKFAAHQEYALAQFNLGMMYENGFGVAKNSKEALWWFREAAEQGDAGAAWKIYLNLPIAEENYQARASKWLTKAAEGGIVDAQFTLARNHDRLCRPKCDVREAAGWYLKAAEQGSAEAMRELGSLYDERNLQPALRNQKKAIEWYRKAAEAGDAHGQYAYGRALFVGRGAPRNQVQAVDWFRRSAENGFGEAAFELGYLYEQGVVLERDWKQALSWYSKALTARNPSRWGGTLWRDDIEDKLLQKSQPNLTSAQIFEGTVLRALMNLDQEYEKRMKQLLTRRQFLAAEELRTEWKGMLLEDYGIAKPNSFTPVARQRFAELEGLADLKNTALMEERMFWAEMIADYKNRLRDATQRGGDANQAAIWRTELEAAEERLAKTFRKASAESSSGLKTGWGVAEPATPSAALVPAPSQAVNVNSPLPSQMEHTIRRPPSTSDAARAGFSAYQCADPLQCASAAGVLLDYFTKGVGLGNLFRGESSAVER